MQISSLEICEIVIPNVPICKKKKWLAHVIKYKITQYCLQSIL